MWRMAAMRGTDAEREDWEESYKAYWERTAILRRVSVGRSRKAKAIGISFSSTYCQQSHLSVSVIEWGSSTLLLPQQRISLPWRSSSEGSGLGVIQGRKPSPCSSPPEQPYLYSFGWITTG